MNKLSTATRIFLEDFVKKVLRHVPIRRIISEYEKRAIAYALFTILRPSAFFRTKFTEEDETQKKESRFEFDMFSCTNAVSAPRIKQFFDLAEAVNSYIILELSIFDEIDDVLDNNVFTIFFDLIFLFHKWEKAYYKEVAEEDDDELIF